MTDATIENPDPADWLMWRRTLDAWGYSPLDEIDSTNVARLQLIWARGLGPGAAQEETPLVYNRIMYMPNPDDLIQAIDAVTGDLLWEYKREWPDDIRDFIRFPGINRNIAIYDDLIIDTSGDDYLFALDALSGELVWETEVLDYRVNTAQQSSGPIIADGKVISGRNCYSEGGPEACVVTAHDALTGEEVWRTSTIPRPGEPGDESWGDVPYENRWHVGTWMVPSYDPELGLIYFGTSVTSPAAKFLRGSNDDSVPLPQLHSGSGHRNGRHRLVLPAHCGSLGSGPSVRTPSDRHRCRTGPERSPMDQPRHRAWRNAACSDRNPRKDRCGLHAGPGNRRVPVGTADRCANRRRRYRCPNRDGDGQSGNGLHRTWTGAAGSVPPPTAASCGPPEPTAH